MKRKVEKDTLVRTCLLFLALLNQCLVLAGFCPLPIEEEEIYQVLTGLLTMGASLWAWWKNNSFTQKALAADEWKEKQGTKEEEKEEKGERE